LGFEVSLLGFEVSLLGFSALGLECSFVLLNFSDFSFSAFDSF
jgi:hypothetical protein